MGFFSPVRKAVIAAGFFLFAQEAFALSIPITVGETLPSTISGLNRSSGPVTVGIPLSEEDAIYNTSQLGLTGVASGQFRVLARWGAELSDTSKPMRWVLVDFQSSVTAGSQQVGATLVNQSQGGNFGGVDLATDLGQALSINTGPAIFILPKTNFNIFQQVTVNGTQLLSSGGAGIRVRDASENVFSSVNDSASTAYIEENGPVHAVVRATGTLRNQAGSGIMGFSVRIHFYKGKTYARLFVTLENANPSSVSAVLFNSADVSLVGSLGIPRKFSFATQTSSVSATYSGSETAYLYQAYSKQAEGANVVIWDAPTPPMDRDVNGVYAQRGYEINHGGTLLHALGTTDTEYSRGWGELSDGSGAGITVCVPWMGANFPSGIELTGDGQVSGEIFSKRNSKKALKFGWGYVETREVLIDFHTATADNPSLYYEAQFPLTGRAPLDQYARSGAFFGETRLVSATEQNQWFQNHNDLLLNVKSSTPSLSNPTSSILRYYSWPQGGGSNQTDLALLDLIDYVRTGGGGFYISGVKNSFFKADTAFVRSPGFEYFSNQVDAGNVNVGAFNGTRFDVAHSHWLSLPIAYYLTGNEIFRDAIHDWGEWNEAMSDGVPPIYFNPLTTLGSGGMRVWSRYYKNFALLYDFTRNPKYLDNLRTMTAMLLDSRDNPPNPNPKGRNLERGYLWMEDSINQYIADFVLVQIHAEAVWDGLNILRRESYTRLGEIEDYLLGLADFSYNDFYFEMGSGMRQYGYLYSYYLYQTNDASNTTWGPGLFRPISSGRLFSFAYEKTGNRKYLDREAKLLAGDIAYVSKRTPSDIKSQRFIYDDLHLSVPEWKPVPNVQVASDGGGSFTLSWQPPAGVVEYELRYSGKKIVDWLFFNQKSRTYIYDPTSHTPWFAAAKTLIQPSSGASSIVLNALPIQPPISFSLRYRSQIRDTSRPKPPLIN